MPRKPGSRRSNGAAMSMPRMTARTRCGRLPRCNLTPHIAGSLGREVTRMATYMIREFERVSAGRPAQYEVTTAMLETMA